MPSLTQLSSNKCSLEQLLLKIQRLVLFNTLLERSLAIIRNKAPKNSIKTQLRAGNDDFIPYIKVAPPHGSGRYEERSISDIDPENLAPNFQLRSTLPGTKTDEAIEKAIHAVNNLKNDDKDKEFGNEVQDDDGYTKVSRKRKERNSPGTSNVEKKRNTDEIEANIVTNLYKKMGLRFLLEENLDEM